MFEAKPHVIAWTLAACAAWGTCQGASSGASSVSDSIGTSVGSVSQSLQNSSNSSSRPANVADGEYRIVEVAAVTDRPDWARLTLEPVVPSTTDGGVFLTLPRRTLDLAHLSVGAVVAARQRPYGLEFTDAGTRQAFYLVLSDEWYQELQTRAVVL